MSADAKWIERNLGYNPNRSPLPRTAFARPETIDSSASQDWQREIIDFDSESDHGRKFLAFTTATGLARYTDVGWPTTLEPKVGKPSSTKQGRPLPRAHVLLVTWTVDEGHALSRVLTPGKDSHDDYLPYTHNYAALAKRMRADCPARQYQRLGTFWTMSIGTKSVVVFKSDSHMSQDGPELPNKDLWRQIIDEVKPALVITTGTAGGIGTAFEVGDVVVSPVVRFDCLSKFKNAPFGQDHYTSSPPRTKHLATARRLFKANAGQLPKDNTRLPRIFRVPTTRLEQSVVTTDFFGFDTSDNHYKLQGLGYASEMGDAVLGLVCSEMGAAAPRWLAVRNVSDPQIKAEGTLKQQAQIAAQIYKGFGRWSSVCSAISCWALIAAEP